jgi:DNA-binding IclR family transcriptional regulator
VITSLLKVATLTELATATESYSSVRSVERAFHIIEILAETREGLTGTDLAQRLGLHRSLVFRLLASLVAAGYVSQQEPGPHYRLNLKLLLLANRFLGSLEFSDLFLPILRHLAEQIGEHVELAVVEDNQLVRVARAEDHGLVQPGQLQVAYAVGSRPTLHASASGKAWLSELPEDQALSFAYQQGLVSFTEHTITSLEALRQELQRARACGFATCLEEESLGVNAIAAPIVLRQNGLSSVVGTVSVTAPIVRVSRERLFDLGPLVVATAVEIAATWPRH